MINERQYRAPSVNSGFFWFLLVPIGYVFAAFAAILGIAYAHHVSTTWSRERKNTWLFAAAMVVVTTIALLCLSYAWVIYQNRTY